MPAGAVLFSSRAPIGYVAVASNPICTNQGFKSFIPERGISSDYLYYYLLRAKPLALKLASGTTFLEVSGKKIATLPVPAPPLAEQQRIAERLDELLSDLDAGVTALERVRAKLEHYRAAVLKAAVEGTLTAEWRRQHPATETADALLTRILAGRRHRWEQAQLAKYEAAGKTPPKDWRAKYVEPVEPDLTGLPALPEGWRWASVEQLGTIGSGQTPSDMPRQSERNGSISWFRVGDMSLPGNEESMTCGGVVLSKATAKLLGLRTFVGGSIIFPKRGGAIATNKKRTLAFDAACDLNLMVVSPIDPVGPLLWVYFQSLNLAELSDGSNVPQLNNPDIAPLAVALPPQIELIPLAEAVEDQLSVIDHLERDLEVRLQGAQALRQSILRCAFSGQLVPQDPNDEPASELLKRIAAEREERARLARAAKQARPKSTSKPRTPRRAAKQQ